METEKTEETLIALCQDTNEILGKAIEISHQVIGVPSKSQEDKGVEEPSASLDLLREKLSITKIRAKILLDQMDFIANRIN